MKHFMYKWLPIIFGCHCMDSRSFHYKGTKFPICARCTGELIGMIASCFTFIFLHPNITFTIILMLPLIIDGFVQALTKYESNNLKRVITGIMFGYGGMNLFLLSSSYVYQLGHAYGMDIFR